MMAQSPNSSTDKDTELTMCDVLEEEKELEEDANAVLGASDDKNCSYDQGYVPRQALYACLSCKVTGEAGICLACCYACHDGHEVVELYTKRNFRCDCGNSKFTDKKCSLRPNKDVINSQNKYNHNFKGLYCICERPYPDLDDSVPDEMIQCICCEDWYHGRHLGVPVPEDYYEMICGKCMESHKFLYTYLNQYEVKVDVVGIPSAESMEATLIKTESKVENIIKEECIVKEESLKSENSTCQVTEKNTVNELVMKEPTQNRKEEKFTCLLKELQSSEDKTSGAAFWPENWRKDLCKCDECLAMYKLIGCEFLLSTDDTIQAYEEKGKSDSDLSQYDKGLSALSSLDRVNQMEAIRAYTSMKGQLKEYLKGFADNKRTVKEADIREFFEQMQKKKKLNNGVPYFCR